MFLEEDFQLVQVYVVLKIVTDSDSSVLIVFSGLFVSAERPFCGTVDNGAGTQSRELPQL